MPRPRLLAVVLPVLLLASACTRERAPVDNLVLVSIDTLAADRTSTYGAARRTTPHLDALAARGLRFDRAYSSSPWTIPSHATMLTGRWPASLSADTNDMGMLRAAPLLSDVLGQQGFRTAAFTGGGFMSAAFGLDSGFDRLERGDPARAAAWLAAHGREGRFFLFFHTFVVHTPYRDRRFADDLPAGRLGEIYSLENGYRGWPLHEQIAFGRIEPTEEEREFVRALYDGGVAAADTMVGELVAALERLDLMGRTVVIVTSDHGEEFWQHAGRGAYHGHTLYDELLRVPLVWYEPGLPTAGSATRAQVSLADLVPTLCARLAVRCPPGADGEDLSALLAGRAWSRAGPIYAEGVRNGPPRYSVRTADGKLIVTPDARVQNAEGAKAPVPVRAPEELYLPDDPEERTNRITDAGEVAARLRRLLDARLATRASAPAASPMPPVDPATRSRLRELGYVDP